MIQDEHSRILKKARISIVEACNFSCAYCMPENKFKFLDRSKLMNPDEVFYIAKGLNQFGIDEIRFTGGEPTLRSDLVQIIEKVSILPLKKIGLTTNALHLEKFLYDLQRNTNLNSINISLDSLNKDKFRSITKVDGFEKVISSILMASTLGFQVKLNMVVMRGVNDHEIIDFINFGIENNIEVRFLELMNIGVMKHHFQHYFISASEMLHNIEKNYKIEFVPSSIDSTSFSYKVNNMGKIGFIASESKPFCHHCSRIRIGPQGDIRSCLMQAKSTYNLKNTNYHDYEMILKQMLEEKPMTRIESQSDLMVQLGG